MAARRLRECQVVVAAAAFIVQMLDGRGGDRGTEARDRRGVERGGGDGERVGSGRPRENELVAAGRVAAIDGDAGQNGWRGRVIEIDRVAAGQGVDRQRGLVTELDRLLL